MALYKKINDLEGNLTAIQNTETTAFIPIDEANVDYQTYLAWVAEGNIPDEVE